MNTLKINWAEKAYQLIQNQMENWSLLKSNYAKLAEIKQRSFNFSGFEIDAQYNPARIISTSADISASAIQSRECFLCRENRPKVQEELFYKNEFLILANPYPILPEHFTIASLNHTAQSIMNNIPVMIELARDLGEKYSIYYNGPRCGASAPDHMHFQAGTKNFLPIEKDYARFKQSAFVEIYNVSGTNIYSIENILRNGISIESNLLEQLIDLTTQIILILKSIEDSDNEPMINIICSFENEKWRVIIFPRRAHRPREYFCEGVNKILISPAVIDLGGILITPRKEDFDNLTNEQIINIYKQVTLNDLAQQNFLKQLKHTLS